MKMNSIGNMTMTRILDKIVTLIPRCLKFNFTFSPVRLFTCFPVRLFTCFSVGQFTCFPVFCFPPTLVTYLQISGPLTLNAISGVLPGIIKPPVKWKPHSCHPNCFHPHQRRWPINLSYLPWNIDHCRDCKRRLALWRFEHVSMGRHSMYGASIWIEFIWMKAYDSGSVSVFDIKKV